MAWGKAGREWEEEWKDDRIGYCTWYKVREKWNICDEKGGREDGKLEKKERQNGVKGRQGITLIKDERKRLPQWGGVTERVEAWYIKKIKRELEREEKEKKRKLRETKKKLEKSWNETEIEMEP